MILLFRLQLLIVNVIIVQINNIKILLIIFVSQIDFTFQQIFLLHLKRSDL